MGICVASVRNEGRFEELCHVSGSSSNAFIFNGVAFLVLGVCCVVCWDSDGGSGSLSNVEFLA